MKNFTLYSEARNAEHVPMNDNFDAAKAAQIMHDHGPRLGFIPSEVKELNTLVEKLGVRVLYDVPGNGETSPYTNTKTWELHMPYPESFTSPEMYAYVMLHELSHYSGQFFARGERMSQGWNLLDQIGITDDMAIEELTAETASARLAELIGLDTRRTSLSYLQSWLRNLNYPEASWDQSQIQADEVVEKYRALMGV